LIGAHEGKKEAMEKRRGKRIKRAEGREVVVPRNFKGLWGRGGINSFLKGGNGEKKIWPTKKNPRA